MKRFMLYMNITDIDILLLFSNEKEIQHKIIDYVLDLKNKGLSAASIAHYVGAIMHFYAMNDVTLNRKRIGRFIPEHIRKQKDRAYTTQEISRLLEFCDLRDRSIVLLFASTGMRIGAVPPLKLEHLTKIQKYGLYKFTVYAGYKEEYVTFCTPECAKAIDSYLQYRERCGEILTEKSPLFREQFDITDLEQIRKKAKNITINAIVMSLKKRLHLANITEIEQLKEGEHSSQKRKKIMRTHGFRKFVNTTMVNAEINTTIRRKLIGHSVKLDESYYRPQTDDFLLQEYLKVVDALTINEENRLRRQVQQLTIEVSEVQQFRKELNELKDLFRNTK
jgi:integrase